ncbi:MAG TPA: hypothetical protein VGB99_00855 [Acidobacteriota bacterium]
MNRKRELLVLASGSILDPSGQQLEILLAGLDRHRFERRAWLPGPGALSERLEAAAVELDFAPGLAPRASKRDSVAASSRVLLGRRCDLVQAEGWRPALVALPRRIARGGKLIWVLRRPPLGRAEARALERLGVRPDRIVAAGGARAADFPPRWQERMVRIEDAIEIPERAAKAARRAAAELLIGPASPESELDLNQMLLHALRILAGELPALRLALAGPGVFRRAVELQTAALGLSQKLRSVAAADEVAIAVVDAAAAPLNLARALACGIPTVAVGGELPDSVAINVARRDLDGLVSALRALAREPARADTLASAGRAYAAAELGPARRVQRFEQLYDQLLS